MAITFHYSRGVRYMSLRSFSGFLIERKALRIRASACAPQRHRAPFSRFLSGAKAGDHRGRPSDLGPFNFPFCFLSRYDFTAREKSPLRGSFVTEHDFRACPGRSRTGAEKANRMNRALQAAEKLLRAVGRGFIPGIKAMESKRASAPAVCFPRFSPEIRPFSAACLAPAKPHDHRGLRLTSFSAACLALICALSATAQYPGQISKSEKDKPELRSIAVLEWTGNPGKPKASRLVPVTVLDGGELRDGGIYLARPQPLALAGEVEYELQAGGKPLGLFDIENTGQEQGSWVGYGSWKQMPKAKPAPPPRLENEDDDAKSDEPVLHRKHHSGDAPSGAKDSGSGSGDNSSSAGAAAADPDRPTLHKGGGAADSSNPTGTTSTPSSDPDQPTLHRHTDSSPSGTASTTASSDDPDRPVLKKTKKKTEDVGRVDTLPDTTDPDRPRLKRGKDDYVLNVVPSLLGLPPDMQQAVAVSDAKNRPEHPWDFTWSNPDDEAKMKSALEDIARNALGLNPPPAPAPKKPAAKTAAKTAAHKTTKPAPPTPPPAELEGEEFRVFELSYGSGATLVLQAHTAGPLSQEKFVTIVAQPDLYGNVLVLLKSVTDGAHLDDTPRMRLVDAVDVMADNRGELLFELRGATQRQFALYRVLRGQAEKLFVTGGGEFGVEAAN